jgi:hypothetical protein
VVVACLVSAITVVAAVGVVIGLPRDGARPAETMPPRITVDARTLSVGECFTNRGDNVG